MSLHVTIDLTDYMCDLSDNDLKRLNLRRDDDIDDIDDTSWRAVCAALRAGDQRTLFDLLSRMAWEQAGVVIPAVGLRPLH